MPPVKSPPEVSIVIPVLNDAPALAGLLVELASVKRELDLEFEVLVVDGGSTDSLSTAVANHEVQLLASEPGRGQQLQVGVERACGAYLWFMHADSQFTPGGLAGCLRALDRLAEPCWGCFDIQLVGHSRWLPTISWFMNWRSRLSSICTGDQGIFCESELLDAAGGVPIQPLMEDVELSRRLRERAKARRLSPVICSAGRRWDEQGVFITMLRMWWFRWRYYFGASPTDLAKEYYPHYEERP